MERLKIIIRYIIYYFNSKNKHYIHSPFIYHLVTEVINKKKRLPIYTEIENLKRNLCKIKREINITDYGAGSNINNSSKRKIKDIARNSSKNSKYGRLLHRLVKHYKPKNILELGTSLGISTCYIAEGNRNAKVYTIEGCPETANTAKENFNQLNINNIQTIIGNFDNTLEGLLKKLQYLDLVFIDGNHRKRPTIEYFKKCLDYANNNTIFIFDDIHWSTGMQDAWKEIQANTSVTATVDLFYIGIVFIKKELSKEHFIVRF